MAAIYNHQTGEEITAGLQGCGVCDEAIRAAQRIADDRGADVELIDDDGRWLVHPGTGPGREPADFLGELDAG